MSPLSFPQTSFPFVDTRGTPGLLVEEAGGTYGAATTDEILSAARLAIDAQVPRGTPMTCAALVKEYLRTRLAGLEIEVFAVLLLDAQYHLIDYVEMFRGTVNQTSVHPREVARLALARNATSVIAAHDHPSGHPEPSQADIALTRRLGDVLGLLDVRLLDHVIVAGARVISLAECGLM